MLPSDISITQGMGAGELTVQTFPFNAYCTQLDTVPALGTMCPDLLIYI